MAVSYREFIETALGEVSEIAVEKFGKVNGTVKSEDNNQVLTEADTLIGKRLIELIQDRYPEHSIIDEEAGVIDKKSEYIWVIDPIDGTSNFAQGVPTYGVMLGLLHRDQSIAGGVSLPAFDELLVAERGCGAYCNDAKIAVTENSKSLSTLVAYIIDGHQENPSMTREEMRILGEIILRIRNLRASGSVFDLAMVAKGKYGGFLCRTSKIWDNVAPQIIVEEAGGVYTDFFGVPIIYESATERTVENYTVCAASPALHKQLQEIIHAKA